MNKNISNIVHGAKIFAAGLAFAVISCEASNTYHVAQKLNAGFQKTPEYIYLREGYDAIMHAEIKPTYQQQKEITKLYYEQYNELLQKYENNLKKVGGE